MTTPDFAQQKASDPQISAWVAASAGSGKTTVLSDRVLRLLLNGALPEKILCLTFTKTAAAEMSNRVANRLSEWATAKDSDLEESLTRLNGQKPTVSLMKRARRLFAELLETAGGVKIMTIHAFAQSLLKRFPLEAGVSPHFEIIEETKSAELAHDAREDVFADAAFAADLETITRQTTPQTFATLMTDMMKYLPSLRRLTEKYPDDAALKAAYDRLLGLPENATEESITRAFCTPDADLTASLRVAAAALLKSSSATDKKNGAVLAEFWSADADARADLCADYRLVFLTKEDEIRADRGLATKQSADFLPLMRQEAARVLAFCRTLNSVALAGCSLALAHVGAATATRYTRKKQSAAVLDYDDLIRTAAALLQNAPAWVMYKLDGGIDHILVDEAQDTSPEQWRIIQSLADEFFAGKGRTGANRTVFVVGDRKQSIYSFQGADPDEFEKMHALFRKKVREANQTFETVPMYTSFRSTPPVIEAVNRLMQNPAAANGVLQNGEDGTHTAARAGQAGRVELWALEKAYKSDTQQTWTKPVERVETDTASARLAAKIARRIARMIFDKEPLISKNRPIEPKDILILVRRRNDLGNDLIRALKALKIPVAGADRLKITEHIAVMDLMVLGDFLLLPSDDLALATVLRSPLCGIGEDDLFTLCANRTRGETVYERLKKYDGEKSALGTAYAFLKNLLNTVGTLKPFDLYADVLQAQGKMKAFAERLGVQAFDALNEFLSLALKFEENQSPSLQLFLKYLRQNDIEIKRTADDSSENAVRLMTVHAAKGLQAPIVFLPDTYAKSHHTPSYFWTAGTDGVFLPVWKAKASLKNDLTENFALRSESEEDKESARLLYVAVTRAADRLYVCGYEQLKAAPENNWYTLFKNAFLSGETQRAADENGNEIFVLHNESDAPAALCAAPEKVEKAPLPVWATTAAAPESTPPKPLAPSHLDKDEDTRYDSPLTADRRAAQIRGRLIHKLLEMCPQCGKDGYETAAKNYVAAHAAEFDDAFRQNVLKQVFGILNNDDYGALFFENSVAEAGIAGVVNSRTFAGKIDRLVVRDKDVLIVDYKSGGHCPDDLSAVEKSHRSQMRAYRDLVKGVYPDKTVRCFLLWTQDGKMAELPDTLLDKS